MEDSSVTGNMSGLQTPPGNSEDHLNPFLLLPHLVQTNLLDKLANKDILNLRLTCHLTLQWVEDYTIPHLQRRLSSKVISLDTRELHSFTETVRTLPFTRFDLSLNINSFTKKYYVALERFASTFGSSIHHLKVTNMYGCVSDEEYEFYNSMTSLKSLKVGWLPLPNSCEEITNCMCEGTCSFTVKSAQRIPPTFLTTLNSISCDICLNNFYPYKLLSVSPSLKFISTPSLTMKTSNSSDTLLFEADRYDEEYIVDIQKLTEALNIRRLAGHGQIQVYLSRINVFWRFASLRTEIVCKLLEAIGSDGANVLNTNTAVLRQIDTNKKNLDESVIKNIYKSIKFLDSNYVSTKLFEMRNVTEFRFVHGHTSPVSYGQRVCNNESLASMKDLAVWPELRKVEGSIYLFGNSESSSREIEVVAGFLDILLMTSQRKKVKELSFDIEMPSLRLTPEHFSLHFPNLRKLLLQMRSLGEFDFSRLFLLLGRNTVIECLDLVSCSVVLDDEAFIGSREAEDQVPVFLNLKCLKEFTFRYEGNDADTSLISGITDETFTSVLQYMPLIKLKLERFKIKLVSPVAFKALEDGELGKHICQLAIEVVEDPFVSSEQLETFQAFDRLCKLAEWNKLRLETKEAFTCGRNQLTWPRGIHPLDV